jgi:hypothetical protein
MQENQLVIQKEFTDAKKKKLRTFYDLPDVTPCVLNKEKAAE